MRKNYVKLLLSVIYFINAKILFLFIKFIQCFKLLLSLYACLYTWQNRRVRPFKKWVF